MLELWLYMYFLPAPLPCVAEVRWPGFQPYPPEWSFVVQTPRPCEDLRPSAAWMYHLGVDPAVPVESEEYEGNIYVDEP